MKTKTKIFTVLFILITLVWSFFAGDDFSNEPNNKLNLALTQQEITKPESADHKVSEPLDEKSIIVEDPAIKSEEQKKLDNPAVHAETPQIADESASEIETNLPITIEDQKKADNPVVHIETPRIAGESASEIETDSPTPIEDQKKSDNPVVQNEITQNASISEENPKTDSKNPIAEVEMPKDKQTDNEDGNFYCTLSIDCSSVLKNYKKLKSNKKEIIPKDGVILKETTVEFFSGESVFDVLNREIRERKIHIDFVSNPMYNSVYIKGIANLYEFDCGDLSGWFYKVNGKKPTFGCSQYKLEPGDRVEWVYTCDFLDSD